MKPDYISKAEKTDNLKIAQGARLQFVGKYPMPQRFSLRDDYRFWPDEITSFVELSLMREVPIATTRRQGFKPSVDAAELLSLLMYDIQVFDIALTGIGEPISEAEKEDANYLAFRAYFRCVYAAWLSTELNAVLNMKTDGDLSNYTQTIQVKLNSIEDDFTNPGPLGGFAANSRRVKLGGASRVFCEVAQVFETHLIKHGLENLPTVHRVATDLFNTLGILKTNVFTGPEIIRRLKTECAMTLLKTECPQDGIFSQECAYWSARSQGAFLILKTALSFLTKGICGLKPISAPSFLQMPPQRTLDKAALDELKDEIISSFVDLSFTQKWKALLLKSINLLNPGTFNIHDFESEKYSDYGFRYAFGEDYDEK